jgi:hypothetical protein
VLLFYELELIQNPTFHLQYLAFHRQGVELAYHLRDLKVLCTKIVQPHSTLH